MSALHAGARLSLLKAEERQKRRMESPRITEQRKRKLSERKKGVRPPMVRAEAPAKKKRIPGPSNGLIRAVSNQVTGRIPQHQPQFRRFRQIVWDYCGLSLHFRDRETIPEYFYLRLKAWAANTVWRTRLTRREHEELLLGWVDGLLQEIAGIVLRLAETGRRLKKEGGRGRFFVKATLPEQTRSTCYLVCEDQGTGDHAVRNVVSLQSPGDFNRSLKRRTRQQRVRKCYRRHDISLRPHLH